MREKNNENERCFYCGKPLTTHGEGITLSTDTMM